MTFGHAWVLLLAWLPGLWVVWEWRDSARRTALILKAAGFAAILIALAEPRLTVHESKVAAAILVDTSASVTSQDLARASDLATHFGAFNVEFTRGPADGIRLAEEGACAVPNHIRQHQYRTLNRAQDRYARSRCFGGCRTAAHRGDVRAAIA